MNIYFEEGHAVSEALLEKIKKEDAAECGIWTEG